MKLRYKSTFIDIEEELEEPLVASRPRSFSLPRGKQREITEEEQGRWAAVCYIATENQLKHARPPACASPGQDEAEASQAEAPEAPQAEAPQADVLENGSLGHPTFCMPPCIYFVKGSCTQGGNCTFCHFTHQEPKPDKRQRLLLRQLPKQDLLRLITSTLRMKERQAARNGEVLPVQETGSNMF